MGYSSANLYEFQVDLKFNYLSPSLKKKNRGCVQMKKKHVFLNVEPESAKLFESSSNGLPSSALVCKHVMEEI